MKTGLGIDLTWEQRARFHAGPFAAGLATAAVAMALGVPTGIAPLLQFCAQIAAGAWSLRRLRKRIASGGQR